MNMENPFLKKMTISTVSTNLSDSRGFTSPLISTCPKKKYSTDNALDFRFHREKLPQEIVDNMMLQLYTLCDQASSKKKANSPCRESLIQPKKREFLLSSQLQRYTFKKKEKGKMGSQKNSNVQNIFNLGTNKFGAYRELKSRIKQMNQIVSASTLYKESSKDIKSKEKDLEQLQKQIKIQTSLEILLQQTVQSPMPKRKKPNTIKYKNKNFYFVQLEEL